MSINNRLKISVVLFSILVGLYSAKANTASFNFTNECEGGTTSFTSTSVASVGSIILHEWDFDGDSIFDATGASVNYQFATSGTYDVLLRITTDSGFTAYTSNPVNVYPNPTVSFNYNGNCLGDPSTFNGSAVVSGGGTITSYDWEFNGNGDFADGSGANQSFTFIAPGYFNVGLRATSDRGCVTDLYNTVTVAPKPTVNFTASNVCDGNAVDFLNNSVALGSAINYTWKFGDGSMSADVEPSHNYAGAGNYTVRLVGSNSAGCVDSLERMVSVYPNPTASFSTADVCDGNAIEIANNSTYNGATVQSNYWSFGDGNSRLDLNSMVNHEYANDGDYTITLSVSTTDNCHDTTTGSVTIHEIPVYDINADGPVEFCIGGEVNLSVSPDSGVFNAWSTGSGEQSITVSESGLYEVVLFTAFGCSYETAQEVLVREPSDLTVAESQTIGNGDEVTLWVEGAMFYEWGAPIDPSENTMMEIEVSPEVSTNYSVVGTNEYGCTSEANINVTVLSTYNLIPSTLMTPDGNGQNDTWFVENIDRYPNCEVRIYDQYGKLIYTQKGYDNDFDGTVNGMELPEATYYYIISCDGRLENFSGNFSILRINKN